MRKSAAERPEIICAPAHDAGKQPFLFGNPQWNLPAPGEPIRQSDMIGVVVSDNHSGHRQAAEPFGEDPLPQLLGLRHDGGRSG